MDAKRTIISYYTSAMQETITAISL